VDERSADEALELDLALRALIEDARVFGVEDYAVEGSPIDASADRPEADSDGVAEAAARPGEAAIAADVAFERTGRAGAADAPTDPDLLDLAAEIDACRRCPLGSTRTCSVPGQGAPRPDLMFVGEAPGAEEDASGLAFVGAAGKLLTKMIEAMGLSRDEVFIGNVLKCRPPGNRAPAPEEVARCLPFLERQIATLRPKVLCALGAHAARALLRVDASVGALRGKAHEAFGAKVVATYHPAFLLRAPENKAKAWEDLKFVLSLMGREPPKRASS
jgi:uracil-DNA glycosylase